MMDSAMEAHLLHARDLCRLADYWIAASREWAARIEGK